MATKKTTKKQSQKHKCALRKWDCKCCNSGGFCELLTDMEVVKKQHHCGFYKKRTEV